MSTEEVERRVDVRAGAPRDPMERPVRRLPPSRRQDRTIARDALLLIGLIIVGLVAVSFLLPNGPLTASATASPGGTLAAVVSAGASTGAPGTAGAPSLTPIVVVEPSVDPNQSPSVAASLAPTAVPTAAPPTPTLKPGETPHPTPKPTPVVTPKPTPAVTPPNTATVIVVMHVINNSGGSAAAADWHMLISGEAGAKATPNGFTGTEAGRSVTIPAGKGYRVTDDASVSGYAGRLASPECLLPDGGGGLAAGTTVTCTITRNDRPHITVVTSVTNDDGGTASASDWTVSVTGANVSKPSFSGSEAGVVVVVGFDVPYGITESGPAGYTESATGDCSAILGVDAPPTSCTFSLDDNPAPTVPETALVIPFLPLVLPRRWRLTRRR
jgi:hypothetical protein